MTLQAYQDFLASKAIVDPPSGLDRIPQLPSFLFPHQGDIVRWGLRRGRAAVFAGTGLGKTLIELAWGQAVAEATGGMVLLFAPLAVSAQILREAARFGIPARLVRSQHECRAGINVTNYQKLDRFELAAFVAVILDESSILKSHDGHYRTRLIRDCAVVPFRLAATATPAPNDFTELGNHAEFLGVLSQTDMLATYFVHDSSDTRVWKLKGHAEDVFWRWMASWAVMLRRPSDLGYPDDGYLLPPLTRREHPVHVEWGPDIEGQFSFLAPIAKTMKERLHARRDSLEERVSKAASLTPHDEPYVWWCNLNAESEGLAAAIPGAVEVRGSDTDDEKERKVVAFSEGRIRVLVTKPTICGFGMNWQHCSRTGFVGLTDSFEQIYQSIRRFWRFGQTREVIADFVFAETEGAVLANLARKEADADRMAAAMVRHMADLSAAEVRGTTRTILPYNPAQPIMLPSWMVN
ncbi:helicase [Tianweitania sediminis]|uniref:Helicase n=1 Tax=Tianweitania sediminis TaxID=1502156 RepID=A0A8J7UGQ7_9HYPH|nr:helicase [Tianweitania sediminis]MBP0438439.1 helicase [Tianweitania sediminis]